MFIKDIIISGFRSYKYQSFSDGLSPNVNTIVGKNGSGKSNFFAAIQFVLNEKYANLRVAERRDLFHSGTGRAALSIFVEIVFDNSDGRMVIPGRAEEREVRIRRTVGLKQDEFRVNDKKFTAAEVHQLLESAGFSASNPYYVVEQGKISHLASMSEEDRYHLIKDVAGTKVYEARKSASQAILADTQVKTEQVDASIAELDNRLQELEAETAELRQFQECDKKKRSIEYCIFNVELNNAKEGLLAVEQEWKRLSASTISSNQTENTVDADIALCTDKISALASQINALEAQKANIQNEITEINNKLAVVELDASDADRKVTRNEKEASSLDKESLQLHDSLKKAKSDYSSKNQLFKSIQEKTHLHQADTDAKVKRLEILQEKRNRTKLFKGKKDRDAWIDTEIKKNKTVLAKESSDLEATRNELAQIERQIKEESKRVAAASKSAAVSEEKLMEEQQRVLSVALGRRDKLNKERRALWQKVHEQESTVQRVSEGFQRAKQQLERSVKFDIRQGLLSLKEVLAEINDENISNAVYGPLIDLIEVSEGFETAVEVTSGNTLFNIVVDSFDVSAKLLEQMNKRRKPGRISFFPLDTCRATARSLPSTAEVSPLISKMKYDKKIEGVVAEVFGKTAVAATLEVGAKISKDLDCDVVTLEGDQFGRRGGITGGFIDKKNSKLGAYRKEREASAALVAERHTLDRLCQEVATIEQSITETLNEIEILQNQNTTAERTADLQLRESRLQAEKVARLETQKDNLLLVRKALEKSIAASNEAIQRLSAEKNEDFKSVWGKTDENELEVLSGEVSAAMAQATSLRSQELQLGTEVQLLADTIQHLERRISIVEDRRRELGWSTHADKGVKHELGTLKDEHSALLLRLEEVNKKIDGVSKEKHAEEARLEGLNSSRLSQAMGTQDRKNAVDKIQVQRNLLTQRRDDALGKIRKLGIIPAGASDYSSYSMGKLMHQLRQVNEELKKFAHVNRKAIDQHMALLESKNSLKAQRDALDHDLKEILGLMEHLEKQKDEAIERTYKQIQFQFEVVFKELAGTDDSVAELQLVTTESSGDSQAEDPYCAARIRVSFGLGAPISSLEQLSGGQKSLVALALIFAIQRCDPAPFYLFDEIDAALDTEYRNAVAKVINRQSSECQFIVASFKPEMVAIAERVWCITFKNRVSEMKITTKDEGIKLLKHAAHERKRTRATRDDFEEDEDHVNSEAHYGA